MRVACGITDYGDAMLNVSEFLDRMWLCEPWSAPQVPPKCPPNAHHVPVRCPSSALLVLSFYGKLIWSWFEHGYNLVSPVYPQVYLGLRQYIFFFKRLRIHLMVSIWHTVWLCFRLTLVHSTSRGVETAGEQNSNISMQENSMICCWVTHLQLAAIY